MTKKAKKAVQDKDVVSRLAELEAENAKLKSALIKQSNYVSVKKPSKWRPALAGFFAIVSVVTFGLWNIGYYVRGTITEQEAFVAATAPLIKDPEIQSALQQEIVKELSARLDVETELAKALPENLQFLASPLAGQVESFANERVGQALSSEKLAQIWEQSLIAAHSTVSRYLANESNDGTITLSDVYAFAGQELQNSKAGFLFGKQLPPKIGEIQLAEIPNVEEARQYLDILNKTVMMLGISSVASCIAALVLSDRRRNMIVGIGVFIVVLMLSTLLALQIGQNQVAQAAVNYPDAARQAFVIITQPLYDQTKGIVALIGSGLLVAIVVSEWRVAAGARLYLRRAMDWVAARFPRFDIPQFFVWVAENRLTIAWTLTAVYFIAFALRMPPSASGVTAALWSSVLTIIGLEMISAAVRRSSLDEAA